MFLGVFFVYAGARGQAMNASFIKKNCFHCSAACLSFKTYFSMTKVLNKLPLKVLNCYVTLKPDFSASNLNKTCSLEVEYTCTGQHDLEAYLIYESITKSASHSQLPPPFLFITR
jgi:hypothetical protein